MAENERIKAKRERNSAKRKRAAVKDAFEELRNFVENLNKAPNIALRGGSFKGLDPNAVYTNKVDGWEVGYRLKDLGVSMLREIFIKSDQKLEDIPEKEREPIVNGILDVFIDMGQGEVTAGQISPFALKFSQTFVPMCLVNTNPNLVSIGSLN
jgi:hypothetical protein